jgi:hypothetical protein
MKSAISILRSRTDDVYREAEFRINRSSVLAELDARHAEANREMFAELDRKMHAPLSSRGAGAPHTVAFSVGSRAIASSPAPRHKPPNRQPIHDPFGTCAGCEALAPGYPDVALAASGNPVNFDGHPWCGTKAAYRNWLATRAPGPGQAK